LQMWESAQIVAQDLATGARHTLVSGGTSPRVLKSGYLVFYRDNTIFAQPFDDRTATVSGTDVPLIQRSSNAPVSGAGQFFVSDSGTLVYIEGAGDEGMNLVWVDRTGKTESIPG